MIHCNNPNSIFFLGGGRQNTPFDAKYGEKCPSLLNNKIALIKQIYLFDDALGKKSVRFYFSYTAHHFNQDRIKLEIRSFIKYSVSGHVSSMCNLHLRFGSGKFGRIQNLKSSDSDQNSVKKNVSPSKFFNVKRHVLEGRIRICGFTLVSWDMDPVYVSPDPQL